MNKDDFKQLEEHHIKEALKHLNMQEYVLQDYLADFIASLCDVDKETMLSDCKSISTSHARWLYWFAYRYLTNESYIKIAERTEKFYGKRFAFQNIAAGISRMNTMIELNPMWLKRWIIVKRIIKQWGDENDEKEEETIVIQVPRSLRSRIKVEFVEK